jgi:L-fuculose-phosphate aldolase
MAAARNRATPGAATLRKAIIDAARNMNALGINQGTSGNVSARSAKAGAAGLLITPSGVPYEDLTPAKIVWMNLDGRWAGDWKPSSEWRFHRDIYAQRPDAQAVVHTHSPHATSLACLGRGIPAFHYMVAVAGGPDIRCAPYATFGSKELSDAALAALDGRKACLLANHGMIAIGGTVAKALALAVEVETLAAQYWRALQIGEPILLSDGEMARVLEKFKTYGTQAEDAS